MDSAPSHSTSSYLDAYTSHRSSTLCFDPTSFNAPHWDVDTFVQSTLSNSTHPLTLEQLHADFIAYRSTLQSQLIDLLNREYTDFIGLASSLTGTSESIAKITAPLTSIHERVEKMSQEVMTTNDAVTRKMEEKKLTLMKKQLLETIHSVVDTVHRIQAMLASIQPIPATSTSTSTSTSTPTSTSASTTSSRTTRLITDALQRAHDTKHDTHTTYTNEDGHVVISNEHDPIMNLYHALCHDENEDDILTSNGILIERLARQFAYLHRLMLKTSQYTIVSQLQTQVSELERTMEQKMEETFLAAFHTSNTTILQQLLRAYTYMDKTSICETVVREKIIRPFVTSHITTERIKSGMSRRSSANQTLPTESTLATIYSELLSFLRGPCSILFTSCDIHSSLVFAFLENSVWKEFASALQAQGTWLFASGLADPFHLHYTLTRSFLTSLASFSTNPTAFHTHPITITFRSGFNLGVYFSLRFREIASRLEEVMDISYQRVVIHDIETSTSSSTSFTLQVSHITYECIQTCWSTHVYMDELIHRFYKLSLQLLSRYIGWIENGIQSENNAIVNEDGTTTTTSTSNNTFPMMTLPYLYVDSQRMTSYVEHDLIDLITSRLTPSLVSSTSSLFVSGLTPLTTRLTSLTSLISSRISSHLIDRCTHVLQAVPRIQSVYRMTNKKAPTTFSPYVTSILNALSSSLHMTSQHEHVITSPADATDEMGQTIPSFTPLPLFLLDPATRDTIIHDVITRVTQLFHTQMTRLLDITQKTEASLARLNTKRVRDTDTMSDSMKIRIQLQLDVAEYARIVKEEMHVTCEEIKSLFELVQENKQ